VKTEDADEGDLEVAASVPYEVLSVFRRDTLPDQRAYFHGIRDLARYQLVRYVKIDPEGGLVLDADGQVVTEPEIFASNDDEHTWSGEMIVEWLQDLSEGKGGLVRRSKRSPLGFVMQPRGFEILRCAYRFSAMQRSDFHYWVPLEEQAKIFSALRLDLAFSWRICNEIQSVLERVKLHLSSRNPDFSWLRWPDKRALRRFLIAVYLYQKRCQLMLCNPCVKAKLRVIYDGCDSNLATARDLIDNLFSRYGRLMVLRVEFYFMVSGDLGKTADSALHCRKKFFNNLRTTKLGKLLLGYVWVLEFASRTGYHFHCMLFLNGDLHERDGFWAQEFVNAWRKYFDPTLTWGNNCNRRDYKERSFLGIVHYADEKKRGLLDENLQYLCKKRQFVTVKESAKVKTFGTSRIDRSERTSKGRPRMSPNLKQSDLVAATTVNPLIVSGEKPAWASGL